MPPEDELLEDKAPAPEPGDSLQTHEEANAAPAGGDEDTIELPPKPPSRRQQAERDRDERIAAAERNAQDASERARAAEERAARAEERAARSHETDRRTSRDTTEGSDLDAETRLKLKGLQKQKWDAIKAGDTSKYDEVEEERDALLLRAAKRAQPAPPAAADPNAAIAKMVRDENADLWTFAQKKGIDLRPLLAAADSKIRRREGLTDGPVLWRKAHEAVAAELEEEGFTRGRAASSGERAAVAGRAAPARAGNGGSAAGALRVRIPASNGRGFMSRADVETIAKRSGMTTERYVRQYARLHPEDVVGA